MCVFCQEVQKSGGAAGTQETVPGASTNLLVPVTFRGSRSSLPSLCIYLLEGQPTGKGQGRGELEVGIGCIPDSISKCFEHSEENALQQMNTPQCLWGKNPFQLVHNSSGQVITVFFSLIF